MRASVGKKRRFWLILGLLILAAALVWAAAELSGQANSLAQDAGSNSADMEMTTLNTIKKPVRTKDAATPPACDWAKERRIKSEIDANDRQYKNLRDRAKSEMSGSGRVSPATKNAVMASAREFKKLCDEYAAMWDACKCRTRAETARKTGESRIRSAEVVAAGEIDEGRLKAMESAQEDMKQARRNYVQEASAGNELSDEDKKDIQTSVVPQITSLLGQVTTLVSNVTSLFGNIQQNVTGAGISAIKSMAMGGGGAGATKALLGPVRTLLNVAKSMLSNVQALSSDAQSLSGGSAGMSASPMGGGKMGMPCFIGTSEE